MRHAFLIAAYNNFFVLEKLMLLLDDERNDIYLHVDKKVEDFDETFFATLCQHARVILVPRMRVYWGDYSQIESIVEMMRLALDRGEYSYLHLVSDSDLPLQSCDEMHRFFTSHAGREFVAFNKASPQAHWWVALRHPLNRYYRSPKPLVRRAYLRARTVALWGQRRLGVDRTAGFGVELRYGSDWYSVSSELAAFIVSRQADLRRMFKGAFIPTEFYVQTLVWNSYFRDRVFDYDEPYRSNVRLIDFARGAGAGSPTTWVEADLDELTSSDRMFARKFDPNVDKVVIEKLYEHVLITSGRA
ncbi:putative glycosyltransferase [Janibacter sp. HTCC2649]|uniref:glycosyl transferase n=1 Tax=Janibacter sp. HTCC2649 TaxID=313589 RepID=UPI000066EA30|nr:glycosyl transferase [Janibacter sp. HTCC2649]EAP99614.1 putative glycosyltransferase [Janibacter sp. HTCC2649]